MKTKLSIWKQLVRLMNGPFNLLTQKVTMTNQLNERKTFPAENKQFEFLQPYSGLDRVLWLAPLYLRRLCGWVWLTLFESGQKMAVRNRTEPEFVRFLLSARNNAMIWRENIFHIKLWNFRYLVREESSLTIVTWNILYYYAHLYLSYPIIVYFALFFYFVF